MKRGKESTKKQFEYKLNRVIAIAIFIFSIVSVIMSIAVTVCGFMRISDFDVEGDHPYEDEIIIAASGIESGERLFFANRSKAKENILRECPYVSDVDIDAKFPSTLRISVTCYTPEWYVEIEDDYYSLDGEFRVLEESEDEQKFVDAKVTKLVIPKIKTAVVGNNLTFGEGGAEFDVAMEFIGLVNDMSFRGRVSFVDVENRFDINIGIDTVVEVYLGGMSGMEEKLRAVERALSSEKLKNCISAKIYAADPSAVYIDATYDYTTTDGGTTENEPNSP